MSARTSSDGGTVKPRALAVLRLMPIANFGRLFERRRTPLRPTVGT
jgi:hypothetical protein